MTEHLDKKQFKEETAYSDAQFKGSVMTGIAKQPELKSSWSYHMHHQEVARAECEMLLHFLLPFTV